MKKKAKSDETPPPSGFKAPSPWRVKLGLGFFILAWIMPGFALIVPWLGLSKAWAASLMGFFILGGPEIALVLAAVFIGQDGVVYFTNRAWNLLKRPDGKVRYYLSVALMVVLQIGPWTGYGYFGKWLPQDFALQVKILAASDLLTLGFFVLAGPEFWGKFVSLFVWEGRGL